MTKGEVKLIVALGDVKHEGNLLRDARIAEIVANNTLSDCEVFAIDAGLAGKNEMERKAYLRAEIFEAVDAVSGAQKARITAETAYKAAKRSLRVMELIYKVQNDG